MSNLSSVHSESGDGDGNPSVDWQRTIAKTGMYLVLEPKCVREHSICAKIWS